MKKPYTPTGQSGLILGFIANGGEGSVMSDALRQQIEAAAIPRTNADTALAMLKKRGLIRYKVNRKAPYPLKLTPKGVMALPEGDTIAPDKRVIVAHPTRGQVSQEQPRPRATVARQEGPEQGVGVLLNGDRVALYVDGKRRDFTRAEFGKTADFFGIFAGK